MMGPTPRAWALASAAAALCCACERAEPALTAPPAPQTDAIALADPTAPAVAGIPQLEPRVPPPAELALPPIPGEAAPVRPARRPRVPQHSADIAAAVAAPAVEHPPLDVLLRAPDLPPAPRPLDLAPPPAAPPSQPKPAPGALDRLGQNIRLDQRKEPIGLAGPRQGTLFETNAGLRIPVDDAVSLEGGVRVDSREQLGVREPDRRSTPRVGVEVRF